MEQLLVFLYQSSPLFYQLPILLLSISLLPLKVRYCWIDLLSKSLFILLPETYNWIDLLSKQRQMKQTYAYKAIVSLFSINLPLYSITNYQFSCRLDRFATKMRIDEVIVNMSPSVFSSTSSPFYSFTKYI